MSDDGEHAGEGEAVAWVRQSVLDKIAKDDTPGFEGVQTLLSRGRSKYCTVPLYARPAAADAGVREALREAALKEAMNAAYSSPHYLGSEGMTPDADGLLQPGSPYDRGRYDARKAIAALALAAKREQANG
jgi:hypothetical protein